MKESTKRLNDEANTLPFSEIYKVTGHLSFEELRRMIGAPNWEPEAEAAMYRSRYFTIRLTAQERPI